MASITKNSFIQYGFDKRIIHGILIHILMLPVYCEVKFENSENHTDINRKKQNDSIFDPIIENAVENFPAASSIKLLPGVYFKEKKIDNIDSIKRSIGTDTDLFNSFQKFLSIHEVDIELPRLQSETGRLFFFKGELIFSIRSFGAKYK